ncbi:MAG: hypothetical protein KJ017_03935 [Alphaproteobacteria bacterium]|nr:hypothetical protein [Alphaproteobacteria bacterium]
MRRDPAEMARLQRLKTPPKESHNRTGSPPKDSLPEELAALVKALARAAAEEDFRAEREQKRRTQ